MPKFYADEAIAVEGFDDLRRGLRRAGGAELNRALSRANRTIVERTIVPLAKRTARGRTNPRPGHAVIDSIRGLGSQSRVQVAMGGARVPQGIGHEFGSVKFRQFPRRTPRVGRGNAGYFFYPAVRESVPEIKATYWDVVLDTVAEAFPD